MNFSNLINKYKEVLRKKIVPKSILSQKKIGEHKVYSQAGQDLFVVNMLNGKKGGYYVEVGAYDEIDNSNTFLLEREFKWKGVSFEIDEVAVKDFNAVRKNKCIAGDATKFDYRSYFEKLQFPSQIDYLSLDIEPSFQTFEVLKRMPLDQYRFSVITYEHDKYVSGDEFMNKSRELIQSYGYKLIVSNVKWQGCDFEDWYIDPNVVPAEIWEKYVNANIEFTDIFSGIAQ